MLEFNRKTFGLIIFGTIIAGIFVEYLNVITNWWVYDYPWNQFPIYGVSPLTIIFGWFVLGAVAFLISFFIWDALKSRETFIDTFEEVWFLSWVIMGVVFEVFNAHILPMWKYNGVWLLLVHPLLGFSLLVPLGYGITALICLVVIKTLRSYSLGD